MTLQEIAIHKKRICENENNFDSHCSHSIFIHYILVYINNIKRSLQDSVKQPLIQILWSLTNWDQRDCNNK